MRALPRISVLLLSAACWTPSHGAGTSAEPDWTEPEPSAARDGVKSFTSLEYKACVTGTTDRWWIGTRGGLVEVEKETLRVRRTYTPADGLAGTQVFALAADGDVLWVGTASGISRFDTASGRMDSIAPGARARQFEADEDPNAIWALCDGGAVTCDRSSGRYRRYRLDGNIGGIVRDGSVLWGAERGCVVRLDTETGEKKEAALPAREPRFAPPRLTVTPRELWALAGEDSRRGGRLFRIDKKTLEVQPHGVRTGLAHDDVQDVLAVGDDVWSYTTGTWDNEAHIGIGARLCRYRRASGQWEVIPAISGKKYDEPTCLALSGGELWVATRAYDRLEDMVVAWGMMPIRRKAPVVEALGFFRFSGGEETWETFLVPAATNYDRITSLELHEGRLWFLLERKPLPESWAARDPGAPKHRVIPGYVDVSSPEARAVLIEEPTVGVVWDRWVRGRKALDLFRRGQRLWLHRLTRGSSQLWCWSADEKWREVAFKSPLSDPRETRLFVLDGQALASCAAANLRFHRERDEWLSWCVGRPWHVTDISRDLHGTWWVGAMLGRVELPADRERTDGDREPLQSGLFRSRDGGSWSVPSIAPWTWHQEDVEGTTRFLPLEEVERAPRDLDLWGATSTSGPRRGARRAVQTKTGEGISCVRSDGERVWVGTFGNGVFCLENERWRRLWPKTAVEAQSRWFVPRSAEDTVTSMALDGDSLWIATVAGLRRCALSDRTAVEVDASAVGLERQIALFDTSDLRYLQRVGPTVTRSGGHTWFWPGGENRGLFVLRTPSRSWKRVMADVQPRCLVADGGTVWIGTTNGLLRYDQETGDRRLFTLRDGILSNSVDAVAIDARSIWVGTTLGITRLERSRFATR